MVFKSFCNAVFDGKMIKKETPEGAGAKKAIDYHNEAMIAIKQFLRDNNDKKLMGTIHKIEKEVDQDNNLAPFEKTKIIYDIHNLLIDT